MASVAPRLVTGAHRIADIAAGLGRVGTLTTVPVVQTDSDTIAGVHAREVLVDNQRRIEAALAAITGPVLTIGGDCSVDIASIITARDRHGDALTVLWIDAHLRLHSPTTHPVAAFHGMAVRTLLGDGPAGLTPARPLAPHQLVIAGECAGHRLEYEYLATTGLRRYGVNDFSRAVDGLTGPVYVHLDLSVLDPDIPATTVRPEPDRVQPQQIIDLLARLSTVVGASVTEYAPLPGDTDNAEPVIRQLTKALTDAIARAHRRSPIDRLVRQRRTTNAPAVGPKPPPR